MACVTVQNSARVSLACKTFRESECHFVHGHLPVRLPFHPVLAGKRAPDWRVPITDCSLDSYLEYEVLRRACC
jgi:hypothetical protein